MVTMEHLEADWQEVRQSASVVKTTEALELDDAKLALAGIPDRGYMMTGQDKRNFSVIRVWEIKLVGSPYVAGLDTQTIKYQVLRRVWGYTPVEGDEDDLFLMGYGHRGAIALHKILFTKAHIIEALKIERTKFIHESHKIEKEFVREIERRLRGCKAIQTARQKVEAFDPSSIELDEPVLTR